MFMKISLIVFLCKKH